LRSIQAFNYIKTKISFQPDTLYILSRLFSPDNKAYVVGYRRLGNSRLINKPNVLRPYPGSNISPQENYMKDKFHHYPLPRYWCIVDAEDRNKSIPRDMQEFEHEPFPWHFIFTQDIRDTVTNIKTVVRGGRISIMHLFKEKEKDLATTTNLAIPLSYYENMIDHPTIASRLLYVALSIRLAVLHTIKKVYPSSNHSKIDDKIHHRIELMIEWHEKIHAEHITKETFDDEISEELLNELANTRPRYHYYATDMHYFKYEKTIHRRETPMEILRKEYPQYSFFFSEFKTMLAAIDREFIVNNHVKNVFEGVDINMQFEIAREVKEQLDSHFPSFFAKTGSSFSFSSSSSSSSSVISAKEKRNYLDMLLENSNYSIYITLLYRVNIGLHLHEITADAVEKMKTRLKELEKAMFPEIQLSKEQMTPLLAKHAVLTEKLKRVRKLRYNMRLFVFTHLDLTQRVYDLNIFSNSEIKSRVPRKNKNYILTHYDETYPFPTRTPHEGGLPDLTKVIYSVPFPDPTNNSSRNVDVLGHDFFKMLSALFPRYYQPRPPVKRHLSLCENFTAYRTLAVRAIEVSLLGAYEHADYMPRYESCVGIHREHRSHFTVERFRTWQSQRGTISILAMREFLTFTVKLNPAYDAYITRNFPFWVDFSKKVYGAADFMRKMYRVENSLGVIQHAIHVIFKPSVDRSVLPSHFIKTIESEDLFQEIRFGLVRKSTKIDELRSFCRKLSSINRDRAKERIPRYGLTKPMAVIIEKRVRLIPPGSPIKLSWLEEFNLGYQEPSEHVVITKFTIQLLSLAFYFIMHGDRGDWQAEQAIKAIPLRDYEIVDAFFFNLHIQYCISVYDLDEDCKKMQWKAVCRRYNITPDIEKHLCSSATSLTYAPCCGMVKSYVSQDCKNPSFGSKELGVDIYSGNVTDRQKTEARLDKKAYRVNTLFYNIVIEAVKRNDEKALLGVCERIVKLVPKKHQTRFYSQATCGSIPVVMVSALGQVVQVKNPRISKTNNTTPAVNSFTICSICASISTFSIRMFGINGFDCNHCDYQFTQQYWIPDCVHCYQKISLEEENYSKIVFDDRPGIGDFGLKRMYVCRHCHKCDTTGYRVYGKWIFTATELKKYKMFHNNGMLKNVITRTGGDLIDYYQTVKQANNIRSVQKQKKSERKIKFQ